MKKQKQELTSEQIYKKNLKRSKLFAFLAPVAWYLFLALTLVFFCMTVRNSVGNLTDIFAELDKTKYGTDELAVHYGALIEKWGEWEIVGVGYGGTAVRFIDVRKAMFSGVMMTMATLTAVSFVCAVAFGKIVFPSLAKMYANSNREMVDIASLKSADKIDSLVSVKVKSKKKKTETEQKGWFE